MGVGGQLTVVISLGSAPCFNSRVTMSVWPCWAAWCKGVYPNWKRKMEENESTKWKQWKVYKKRPVYSISRCSTYPGLAVNVCLQLE